LPWSVDLSEESVVPHSGAPAKKRVLRSLSEFSEPNSAQLSEEQARPEYRVPPKKERSRLPSWARARFKIPGNPWVTHLMLAIIAGVFVLQYIKGGSTSIPVLVTLGARSNVLVSHGQWWRLFTYQFLHIGLMHFGLNAFSLYWLGPGVEYAFGHLSFLLIYLGSGTAGGIAGYLFGGPMARTVAAGASGAIFGLFGAYAYYALTQPGNTRRLALRQIGLIILLNIVFGLSQPGIDNLAHMGGLAGGFLLSVIFGPTEKTSLTHRFLAVSLLLGIFLASGGMQLLSIMLHS
jgi:rhomboid protease GluP